MSNPLEIFDQQEAERAKELKKLTQNPCYDHTQCGEDCIRDCPHYTEKKPVVKSKPAYTKGPWRKGSPGSIVSDHPIPGVDGNDHVKYYGGHCVCESLTDANAERIIACVNACAGINTEALEAGLIKYMLKVLIENRMKFPMNWGIPDNEITFLGVKILEESEK